MTESKSGNKGSVDTSFHNLIQFIPAGQVNKQSGEKERKKLVHISSQDGKEIKNFYETLLSESQSNQTASKSPPKSNEHHKPSSSKSKRKYSTSKAARNVNEINPVKSLSSSKPTDGCGEKKFFTSFDFIHRQHFKLLQNAQLGHINEVESLLKSGLDVDFKDFYEWTPLMCAANEGHSDVVTILLQAGAQRSLCNSMGDTASSIAKKAGYPKLSELILQFSNRECLEEEHQDEETLSNSGTFYCDICKQEFSLKEDKYHKTSTVHLFNSGKKKSAPAFLIPETNRGYQMLLRSGWSGDKGLGPEGKGNTYPVKTVLKRDRKGLGDDHDKKKAKITHFSAKDESAVQSNSFTRRDMSIRTLAKKAQKLKEKREKQHVKNLRYEMS